MQTVILAVSLVCFVLFFCKILEECFAFAATFLCLMIIAVIVFMLHLMSWNLIATFSHWRYIYYTAFVSSKKTTLMQAKIISMHLAAWHSKHCRKTECSLEQGLGQWGKRRFGGRLSGWKWNSNGLYELDWNWNGLSDCDRNCNLLLVLNNT